jgi:nucleotide-binding universal stress UspA family protein
MEAALRGAALRIVAAAAAPPGMRSRASAGEYERVTDVLLGERDQALAAAAERAAKTAPSVLIDTDPLHGPAAQAVTESGTGAQMLVLGSRGIGAFTALLLGSVSRYAASHASCPMVVVRDEAPSPHGLIGVGVADLDTCGDALTFAFEEASLRKAALLVVHAWHTPQTEISRAGQAFTPPGPQAAAADAARHLSGLLDDWWAATDGSYPVGQMRVPASPASKASASASRPMAAGFPVASLKRHAASILGPIEPAGKSRFRSSAGVARRIGRACGVP